ncbi:MAG: META domain-containing protein [Propionicimonas sp.]
MDDAERAFRDALHRVDSVKIPVPSLESAQVRRTRGRGLALGRWVAAAAAIAVVASLGTWMLTVRGQPVSAVPAAPGPATASIQLLGATWVSMELNGRPTEPSPEKAPFVEFSADSTFTGGDPCNHVGGTYRLVGDDLSLSRNGDMTEMGCNVTQQTEFLKVLDGTRRAQRSGDTLVLLDASGNALGRFRATVSQGEPGPVPTPTPTEDPNLPTQNPVIVPTGPIPTSNSTSAAVVEIRVQNVSDIDFDEVRVTFPNGLSVDYGSVSSGASASYAQVDQPAYRYAALQVTVAGRDYNLQPVDYVGEIALKPGKYAYVLDLINGRLDLTFAIDG